MNKTNLVLGILLAGLTVSVYLIVGNKDKEAQQYKLEAQRQQGLSEAYKKNYDDLKPQIESLRLSNNALLSTVRELQTKVDSIQTPPPPGPTPDDNKVKLDLENAGLKFDWSKVSTQLLPQDGGLIWKWQQEAANGPVLRQKISGYEELTGAQSKLLDGKEREIGLLNLGTQNLTLALDAQTKRAENLNQAVKACESARRDERIKWWLKVGGAAAAGYFVGRAIK